MSISTNNSNSKPNFKELARVIARELEIENSQVHLLNFTTKEGGYLVRWGIFPAASANYISNITALSIILRLKENHVQFPGTVGNYQLVEWNAEPQKKLTWWQQHHTAVVAGVITSVLLGLSAMGIWLVQRHRQRAASGAYEPVDAIVAEQELQPLRM